jgi:glycosyltransferase involved in cell wall biosynthesis
MNNEKDSQIVTVAVITYNSADTILETLESILVQSYGPENIELIISDDASNDYTAKVIDKWLKINETYFSTVNFIANPVNKGIPGNCNTAWKASTSNWIKTIAGDDLLEECCILENIIYVKEQPECRVLFSKMEWFGDIQKITPEPYDLRFFKLSAKDQYSYMKYFSFNFAPTSFIMRDVLNAIGFANEKYKTIEDLPLWLKLTSQGYKLDFLNSLTVRYRVSESVSKSNTQYVNVSFLYDVIQINKDNKSPFLNNPISYIYRIEQLTMLYAKLLISKLCNNKKSNLSRLLDRLSFFLRPFHFYWAIKRRCFNFILKAKLTSWM